MSQFELLPRAKSVIGTWTPKAAVPQSIRKFGRFPNVDEWLPGDVVLLRAISPGRVDKAIRKVQECGYDAVHARWSHAALYIGDGLSLCEALRHGVQVNAMYHYLQSHAVRVRRFPTLSAEERWLLAIYALRALGQRYAFGTILKIGRRLRSGGLGSQLGLPFALRSRHFPTAVICSSLISTAYIKCTGFALEDPFVGESTPAFLSKTDQLSDISLGWRAISQS